MTLIVSHPKTVMENMLSGSEASGGLPIPDHVINGQAFWNVESLRDRRRRRDTCTGRWVVEYISSALGELRSRDRHMGAEGIPRARCADDRAGI